MAVKGGIQGGSRIGLSPQLDPFESFAAVPTYAGSTNFATLGGSGATPGVNQQAWTDDFGVSWKFVSNGNGTGEWMQVLPNGQLARAGQAAESIARAGSSVRPGASLGSNPTTAPRTLPNGGGVGGGGGGVNPGVQGALKDYSALANDTSITDDFNTRDKAWQDLLGAGIMNAAGTRQTQITNQRATDNTLRGAAAQHSSSRQSVYDQFMNETNGLMNPLSARGYGADVASSAADIGRQTDSYNFLSGVGGGSLDYQAALSGLSQADYQTAQQTLAQLSQYSSNPEDVQRQLNGLGQIEDDISHGADGQRAALADIIKDLQSGGDGQRAAIGKLEQELAHGGDYQMEALNKYRELSDPKVTAQERYIAELARRSFESQDRSNREAQMQDLSLRGLRSGGAEISGALASQERLGQDRTLAELGLQANAVQRSMVAQEGFAGMSNNMRAAQQQGLALYTQAQNALRDAQQRGLALRADEENAIREAQQRGIAMYNEAAAQIRDQNDRVGLANTDWANQNSMFNAGQANNISMFNADAYNTNSMFNAGQANQVSMFNAGQQNNASANNQQTRLSGGIAAGNMANSIRSMNDSISMFNKEQSQITQRFQDQFAQNENIRIGNLAGTRAEEGRSAADSIWGDQKDIWSADTGTNKLEGDSGQDFVDNLFRAYPPFFQGASFGTGLKQQDKGSQMGDLALKAWSAAGGTSPRKMV